MNSDHPSFLSQYSPIITPFVSVLGSALIAWITSKWVARRTVCKQAFSELLRSLDDFEDAAENLFLQSGNASNANALFRVALSRNTRLGRRIAELFRAHQSKNRLAGADPVPPRVTAALIALRKVGVADELLSPERAAIPPSDLRFMELTSCVSQLRNELRNEAEDMHAGDLQT